MTTIILITLIAFFGHCEDFLGTTLLSRPLVLGPLVGLVLGDVGQGIIMGATLELIFMGNIKVGAAIPPDVITGGVLGTAFAIMSGKGTSIALGLAVPISILAEMILSGLFISRSVFNKKFEQYAAAGEVDKFQRLHIFSGLLKPILMALIVFLALFLGADVMKVFLDQIPKWVNDGLNVAGNMLPALGFALLMQVMFNKKVAPYFFLGFILGSYLKLPMIAIGGLGIIIALIMTKIMDQGLSGGDEPSQEGEGLRPALEKKEIRNIFWRSMTLEANFNFETCQNTGFAFSIIHVLKKFYKTKEEMAVALKRHLQFFNTSPYGSTLILGVTAAMEEQNAKNPEFNPDSINAVKVGLMGPLAGVFDSLFWGTLKVVAAGVGASLALEGNILGPILFVIIYNGPHLWLRYKLAFVGYTQGNRFLQRLSGSQLMDNLTFGASIVGLMVVGAMPSLLMSVTTPIQIGNGDSAVALQGVLDQLAPGIIPLGITFLTYFLLKKNIKVTYLLLGLLALGFLGNVIYLFN